MINQVVFGAIAGSIPINTGARPSNLDQITFTPLNLLPNDWLFGNTISKLVDGNTVDSGMIAQIPYQGDFAFSATATAPFYLNQFTLWSGQYNSQNNGPSRLSIYAETSQATLLYRTALLFNDTNTGQPPQTFDLRAITALDNPASEYTIVFEQHSGSYSSVLELKLFGAFA